MSFYESREWLRLRYDALRKSDGSCVVCGRSKFDGAVLHVDHIKPRSLFPELELEPSNLQVLCAQCNLGKGNRDGTDWALHHKAEQLADSAGVLIAEFRSVLADAEAAAQPLDPIILTRFIAIQRVLPLLAEMSDRGRRQMARAKSFTPVRLVGKEDA